MKDNEDKYLDDLNRKIITEGSIESPSLNFTDLVMSQIELISSSTKIIYKPLISKTNWILILIGFSALVVYVCVTGVEINSSGWLSEISNSILSKNKISQLLPGLKMSKTVIYTIILFGIMFSIQIPILKHYLNKRFEI